jgi:hypothetical protein
MDRDLPGNSADWHVPRSIATVSGQAIMSSRDPVTSLPEALMSLTDLVHADRAVLTQ